MVPLPKLEVLNWNWSKLLRLWDQSLRFPLQPTEPISSVEPQKQPFIGVTPMILHQSLEIPATMSALMMLFSQQDTLSFSPHAVWTISEFGTQKQDKNCWELRYRALNATVFTSPKMVRVFCQVGMMVRLELSFHKVENCSIISMMHTIMVSPQSTEPMIARRLSQVVWKVKLEFGELEDRRK